MASISSAVKELGSQMSFLDKITVIGLFVKNGFSELKR